MEEIEHPQPLSLKRRILTAIGLPIWVLFGFIVAAITIGLIDQALTVTGTIPEGSLNSSLRNTVIAALVYVLTLVIVIGAPWAVRGIRTTWQELGLTKLPTWVDIALAPAAFIAYTIIAGIVIVAVSSLIPGFDANEAQDVGFEAMSKYYEYILAFITLVVIAPVCEEVLIRGYLYGKLRKVSSFIVALLISSVLFALMHFQWNVAVNVFPLAVILVLLRAKTNSIWAGIFLHMLKNGIAFYLLFINPTFFHTIGG